MLSAIVGGGTRRTESENLREGGRGAKARPRELWQVHAHQLLQHKAPRLMFERQEALFEDA
jgi:hypothetical protein